MRLSAKADYALRATVELASLGDGHVKGETLSRAQSIPLRFLTNRHSKWRSINKMRDLS